MFCCVVSVSFSYLENGWERGRQNGKIKTYAADVYFTYVVGLQQDLDVAEFLGETGVIASR